MKTMNAIRHHTTALTKLAAAALAVSGLGLATTAFSAGTANADNDTDVAAFVQAHPNDEIAKAALQGDQPLRRVDMPSRAPGFPDGSCFLSSPPLSPNAVKAFDCINNTMPGGPQFARHEIFANPNTLNNAFQADARRTALQPCPGSSDSAPATWNATNPPPASGSVMCYTSSDTTAHVEWTNTTDLVKVNASGPDMASLYGWWHGLITTA